MIQVLSRSGFRIFFLLAASAGVVLPITWVLVLGGHAPLGGGLDPVSWHIHEMTFGLFGAVLAGFLLTAAAVWTRRSTASGLPLMGLALLWISGRWAMAMPGLPSMIAVLPDLLWLLGAALAIGVPIVRARSWRNLGFPLLLAGLAVAHAVQILAPGWGRWAWMVALDLVLVALVLVTARVVPMFTRNGLQDPSIARWVVADRIALGTVLAVLALDLGGIGGGVAGLVLAAAAVALVVRQLPWRSERTLRVPLVSVLHLGHLWMPVGLGLLAAHRLGLAVPSSAGIHALTLGAMMTLCLGMMARVSLGHTGRALQAPWGVALAFGLLTIAAVVRVLAALVPWNLTAWVLVAALMAVAWLLFLVHYTPILVAPRPDGRPE